MCTLRYAFLCPINSNYAYETERKTANLPSSSEAFTILDFLGITNRPSKRSQRASLDRQVLVLNLVLSCSIFHPIPLRLFWSFLSQHVTTCHNITYQGTTPRTPSDSHQALGVPQTLQFQLLKPGLQLRWANNGEHVHCKCDSFTLEASSYMNTIQQRHPKTSYTMLHYVTLCYTMLHYVTLVLENL